MEEWKISMARIIITTRGHKCYYNDGGHFHREDGPAIIYPDGSLFWRNNGAPIAKEVPSAYRSNGAYYWRLSHGIRGLRSEDHPNGLKRKTIDEVVQWPEL